MRNFWRNTKKTNNSGTLQRAYNTRNVGNEQGENKKDIYLHLSVMNIDADIKKIRRFEL